MSRAARRFLAGSLSAISVIGFLAGAAVAQVQPVQLVAGGAVVSATNPLPTTATISGSVTVNDNITAISSLPTLSAGAQIPRGSLAGAAYSQPVFGSATGGGTQVDATHGLPVLQAPQPSARNFPGCTVGTSSATCLAASTAVSVLQLQNTSVGANIACAFGAAAVLNSSTSFQLSPGQPALWGPNTAGVPSGALYCIASVASTPLYVEWN